MAGEETELPELLKLPKKTFVEQWPLVNMELHRVYKELVGLRGFFPLGRQLFIFFLRQRGTPRKESGKSIFKERYFRSYKYRNQYGMSSMYFSNLMLVLLKDISLTYWQSYKSV